MTIKTLLWADCLICKKPFMFYAYGHFINCYNEEHEVCFYDNNIGEIHNNSYLHCVKSLKCRKCRIAHQLEEFL